MLNLSDKELDRLSREAADRHDPGDLIGPRSWERLELRLDKELGRIGPSPLQGVRRIPFYYAPVIILLVGVSYYFVRQGKGNHDKTEPTGSPPLTAVKPQAAVSTDTNQSTKTSEYSLNSTPPSTSETSARRAALDHPQSSAPAEAIIHLDTTLSSVTSAYSKAGNGPGNSKTTLPAAPADPERNLALPPGLAASKANGNATHPSTRSPHTPRISSESTHPGSAVSPGSTSSGSTNTRNAVTSPGSVASHNVTRETAGLSRTHRPKKNAGSTPPSNSSPSMIPADPAGSSGNAAASAGVPPSSPGLTAVSATRQAEHSPIQGVHSLARIRGVDDSALKAFVGGPVASPIRLDKKQNASLHISRPLQFGVAFSPDFASVHSLAGDRPGSSIGLTMDYQFADRAYLSTGLLLTRKNYAASPQDYHVPPNYYNIYSVRDVNLIKGSFYMLEIPLNLRYDFHITGNTVFFLSGGASSYLLTSEHSQYYYDLFGRLACRNFNKGEEARGKNYLFAAVNLSMGVETGISNDFSLLVAPYVKVPTTGMGFGQVQITSVGLTFALKYAPVLARKRQH